MTHAVIYHNPRCSKSRQTLELVREHAQSVEVIEYLKTPPTEEALKQLLSMLSLSPRELMRTKEAEYKDQGLAQVDDEQALIQAMLDTPKLIERPIVVVADKAAIGRPPENVLTLLGVNA
ncbi:arsenate reductase (glutaredoxin) [Paraferrimonas sedimenticola]|uniref:Arsenate reductase n=1 Tax=Paraferrimonas sedimenticola TaxID=375674 RepID=A0AA37RRD4_9GAMM|nr:arsenate reductase (glutaredoxin) [Paraferrimonas sedimenticola]GLP94770.1 arsenate reductase [Paraferrimonas sedimenticola]